MRARLVLKVRYVSKHVDPLIAKTIKVESLPPDCATADFTVGTKHLRITKQPDQSITMERLPDLKTK